MERTLTSPANVDNTRLPILEDANTSNDDIVTYKQVTTICSELCLVIDGN